MPNNITFIKCDVEGHELSVIKGASQLLAKCRPAWLIEISGHLYDGGSPAGELFRYLRRHDYAPYWFNGQKLIKATPGDKSINYFFLHPSHLAQLRSFDIILEKR